MTSPELRGEFAPNAPAAAHAPPGPSRQGVDAMFDRIAHRYDTANRVLSMGLDVGWRNELLHQLPAGDALKVLDVATGTADLALALAKSPRVAHVTGVDISAGMLDYGKKKVAARAQSERVELLMGDALELSAHRGFDVVTIAFGIRNVKDVGRALRGFCAALRPGGRALILEFSEPSAPVFSPVYRLYRRHILPVIGGWLSGDQSAYRYLDATIATFPHGKAFEAAMIEAGFDNVTSTRLTLGSVTLYRGDAPATPSAS
jgi:demethylmenaquinone methyltransferase/2-methoxy-6-polyprenyl-1,4-benzoquinol methylase